MRRARAAAAAALLLAGTGALAFVRTLDERGLCLWWGPRTIHYVTNASGFTSGAGCAAPTAAVDASFPAWAGATRAGEARPCTDVSLVSDGPSSETAIGYVSNPPPGAPNVNLVVFRKGLCSEVPASDPCHATLGACAAAHDCWEHATSGSADTIALTTTTYVVSTGELLDADVELQGWNGLAVPLATGLYFTCAGPGRPTCSSSTDPYGSTGCNAYDIQDAVTHEAGHVLGLDHTPVAGATMAATAVFGETSKRTLAPDDVDGVCTIYPAGKATSTCVPPGAASGCGCGAGSGGELALGAVALLAWRRRRRARGRDQATIAPA